MSVLLNLSTLAVRQLVGGACRTLGLDAGEKAAEAVAHVLSKHFTDHSQRLTAALRNANQRAWKALEISLLGDSLRQRARIAWATAEDKAFREQFQAFLDVAPLVKGSAAKPAFCRQCLAEISAAWAKDVLTGGPLASAELARQAGAFARFASSEALLDAEWQVVRRLSGALRKAKCETLVGGAYFEGKGVAKDRAAAACLYRKSA